MDLSELSSRVGALSQNMDLMLQGLREIKTENEQLRKFINKQLVSKTASTDIPEPQICPPEKFSGERSRFRDFQNSCTLYFQLKPKTYPNDRLRVLTVISYLTGEARTWANTFYETNDPILNSLESFFFSNVSIVSGSR
ncbi:protein LDOC1-like [Bombina bombina]|uniref:protein LDOC1-like n=1 Tax=Bombina bombina TaxID=8345 RepID=UPI00235A6BF6|nr:protein LDOC1-like [Bombina bombina]